MTEEDFLSINQRRWTPESIAELGLQWNETLKRGTRYAFNPLGIRFGYFNETAYKDISNFSDIVIDEMFGQDCDEIRAYLGPDMLRTFLAVCSSPLPCVATQIQEEACGIPKQRPDPLPHVKARIAERQRQRDVRLKVYVIGVVGGDTVKIGISKDIPKRLASLQTASGQKLAVLAILDKGNISAQQFEADLHKQFASWRLEGEWFRKCPEILDLIASANLDVVI